MKNLSPHIPWEEATHTDTGLRNEPTPAQIANMQLWAYNIFEPTRVHFGKAINIKSLFRSPEVNNHKDVNGSATSDHLCNTGAAGDLDNDLKSPTNAEIFHYIKDNLTFDQLIWEFGDATQPAWVHVSYRKNSNRKEVKVSYKVIENGKKKTKYKNYI